MHKFPSGSALLLAVLLAGCGDAQGEGPMKPGIYAFEAPDGSRHRMVFGKDGAYSDMLDNQPKPVGQGTWFRRGGQLCLKSDKTGTDLCLDEKARGDDGSFTLSGNGIVTHFMLEASAS